MADDSPAQSGGIGRQLIESAGTGFVLIAFVVPVVAAIAAAGVRNVAFLNLVHVVSGAVWAGATVFVAGVFGPTLMGVEPQVRGQVNTPMIPKNVFLFSGVAIATLLTGPMLAVRMGIWSLSDPYILATVLIALALLAGAAYLIRLQVPVYAETGTPGPPDGDRVASLAEKIGKTSPVMLVLQLAILVDMSLLATA